MWLEAVVTREDFVETLREILPVKIHLGAEGESDRWLVLHRATRVELVADEGLRVTCGAALRWSFAGATATAEIDGLSVLGRLEVVDGEGLDGQVLELALAIEEADVRGLPDLVDATIVKAVNVALSRHKLSWSFAPALARTVKLGGAFQPLEALKLQVTWAKQRISEEALKLAASFEIRFERGAALAALRPTKENIMEHFNGEGVFTSDARRVDPAVEQLKSFCRGEMSAVETYHQAMAATHDEGILAQLKLNLASHEGRVALLQRRIAELGEDPPESSGPWGTIAKMIEGTASAIGEGPALSLLEEGERHGLNDYRVDLSSLDTTSLRLVSEQIVPRQEETHHALAAITHHHHS